MASLRQARDALHLRYRHRPWYGGVAVVYDADEKTHVVALYTRNYGRWYDERIPYLEGGHPVVLTRDPTGRLAEATKAIR